ncbi:MAG: MBL fold metallo-hydrolase [Candidatus Daviesbacteria bacterium]|nr:MBL fold metallo-hydrolase [Candidatus Daviesbacteria bacterium]
MDISYFGQSCFKIKGKSASVVIDPFTPEMIGLKLPKDLSADIVLQSHDHGDHNNAAGVLNNQMVFTNPGEYEVGGVVMTGINSFHDDTQGQERGVNTIYHILIDGLNIVHLGDLGQAKLTEEQITEIGEVDILLIPVGGVYTIDSKGAVGIVAQLEPKIIIPMHYLLPGLKVDLESVDNFLKEIGTEHVVEEQKLSITKDKLPEEPQVILLAKSS